jgi:hypothetical protein
MSHTILCLLFLFLTSLAWGDENHYLRLPYKSNTVTNRHISEVQLPPPGTSCFEIDWDILKGWERSSGLSFESFFFVFGCLFCVSVMRSRLFVYTFWLHTIGSYFRTNCDAPRFNIYRRSGGGEKASTVFWRSFSYIEFSFVSRLTG